MRSNVVIGLLGSCQRRLMTASTSILMRPVNLVAPFALLNRDGWYPSDLANGLFEWFNRRLMWPLVLPPVIVHDLWLLLAHKIVLRIVGAQPILIILAIIYPFELD